MSEISCQSRLLKITFNCFLIFIFTSGISITLSQGFLLLTFLFWSYGCYKKEDGFKYYRTGLEKYITAFVAVSILLAFLSPSIIKNLIYIRDFWLIFAFILASSIINSREEIKKIFYLILFTALFQSLCGYIQYFTNINFLDAYRFGLDHPQAILFERQIVGFLGHHLTFSGYMMMISIPVFYVAILKDDYISKKMGLLIRITAVSLVLTIILSWARSVILSLATSSIPVLFKRTRLFLILSGTIIICLLVIFTFLGPSEKLMENLYNRSSQVRIQIWTNACNVWQLSPILGVGGGNYNELFKKEVEEKSRKANYHFRYYFPSHVTHAHNDYLNQLARKGIVGLLTFLYMLYGIFMYMYRNLNNIDNRFHRYFYMGLFGSFTAFLMASMFQCFYTDEENLVMLWLNTGLLAAIVKVEEQERA